jgi:biopolymer transport protein ExbD
MNFRRGSQTEELEINFIPLIDVLLVIIIFLVISTTFSKFSELKVNLPSAEAAPQDKEIDRIDIVITSDNEFYINEEKLNKDSIEDLANKLKDIKSSIISEEQPSVVISADAFSNHQSVINIMEAARLSGLNKVTFATQVN